MMTRLRCFQCQKVHGCIDMLRWGNNPHFCGLCSQANFCHFRTSQASVSENVEYKCPNCVGTKKKLTADEECSLVFSRMADKHVAWVKTQEDMKGLPDSDTYTPA